MFYHVLPLLSQRVATNIEPSPDSLLIFGCRIRVSLDKGLLHWVDEVHWKHVENREIAQTLSSIKVDQGEML